MKLLVMVFGFAASINTHGTTLVASIEAAMAHDSGMSAAKYALQMGQEKAKQGRALLLPQLSLTANSGIERQDDVPTALIRGEYVASMQQTLFDAAKYAQSQQGTLSHRLAVLMYRQAEEELILSVSDAYLSILWKKKAFQARGSAKKVFETQLAAAKLAFELGDGTRTEVDEAQVKHDNALAAAISAYTELEIVNNVYQRLTGLNAAAVTPLKEVCHRTMLTFDKVQIWDEVLDKYSALGIAALRVEQAQTDLTAAKNNHLPQVNAHATYAQTWQRSARKGAYPDFNTESGRRYVGISLSLPLFTGGNHASINREMVAAMGKAKALLTNEQRLAFQETQSVLMKIQHGFALLKARDQAVVSSQKRLASTQYGREIGLRTNEATLDAVNEYYDAISAQAEASHQLLMHRLKLARIRGQLNGPFLASIKCL
ncbi:MAG: TolC family protein [Neisseriaceae bacterium]|nr:TolC family protein [Neisseriaceae bacterium]